MIFVLFVTFLITWRICLLQEFRGRRVVGIGTGLFLGAGLFWPLSLGNGLSTEATTPVVTGIVFFLKIGLPAFALLTTVGWLFSKKANSTVQTRLERIEPSPKELDRRNPLWSHLDD